MKVARLAQSIGLTPEDFSRRFAYIVAHEPPPLVLLPRGAHEAR